MTYTLLPEITRGIILVFATVILILYMYGIIRMLDMGWKNIRLVLTALMLLALFVLYQGMIMYQQSDLESFNMPVILLIPALVMFFVYIGYILYSIVNWQRENISGMSVKEAFDRLPTCLLFYSPQGMPVMVNEAMRSLAYDLLGRPLTDGAGFWEKVRERRIKTTTGDDDVAIVKTDDGRVFSIIRNKHKFDDGYVYELTAVDISREYELTLELESGRDKARILNNRLKALMGTIEYVTMNRELLRLKTTLHDNIGQSILIAKRYLHTPSSVDRKRMLDFWVDNVNHLISGIPEEWELPYFVISKEADRLGIHLNIIGELPVEKELIPIVDAAVSVHIGNTLKHADGTEVDIAVKRTDGNYEISLTNNGRQPEGEIIEKGGLANLRREIESIGGRMEVLSSPVFELKVTLPCVNTYFWR